MPRLTFPSPFDNQVFADTQVIKCKERSTGRNAQALRFSSTLGNYHAIDQWGQGVPVWWEPEQKTLTINGLTLAEGDYVVSVDGVMSRLSEDAFSSRFEVRENATPYGAPYDAP